MTLTSLLFCSGQMALLHKVKDHSLSAVTSEEGRKGQRVPLHGFSNAPGAKIFVLFFKTLLYLLEQDPHTQTSLIHLV